MGQKYFFSVFGKISMGGTFGIPFLFCIFIYFVSCVRKQVHVMSGQNLALA